MIRLGLGKGNEGESGFDQEKGRSRYGNGKRVSEVKVTEEDDPRSPVNSRYSPIMVAIEMIVAK